MPQPFVPIIMGSGPDLNHAKKISAGLDKWLIGYDYRVASAHKHPEYVLRIIEEYDKNSGLSVVYITVAGRSDALTGFVAANTQNPVIGCPPYSDRYAGLPVLSTIYMPSRTPAMFVQDPENAALAAVKIFAMSNEELKTGLQRFLAETKERIEAADKEIRGKNND